VTSQLILGAYNSVMRVYEKQFVGEGSELLAIDLAQVEAEATKHL
jgi:hypothetical protein